MKENFEIDDFMSSLQAMINKYNEMKWENISLKATLENLRNGYYAYLKPNEDISTYSVQQAREDYRRLCDEENVKCETCPFYYTPACSFEDIDYDVLQNWAKKHPDKEDK